jgi:hypothetical protein
VGKKLRVLICVGGKEKQSKVMGVEKSAHRLATKMVA